MAFIDKAMVVRKLVVYPMFASLSSELTNVDCTGPSGNEARIARGGVVPIQTQPSQPRRQAEAADPGVVLKPVEAVLSRPPPGVIPHPHHLLDRQPHGSQVPLSDSRVCSTYFTRWASPQHAHAVQPVISHTIVMFPMPIERLNACPKQ